MRFGFEHIILFGIAGIFLVVLWFAVSSDLRFMKECMEDGKKRYECEAMLKHGNSVPIFLH